MEAWEIIVLLFLLVSILMLVALPFAFKNAKKEKARKAEEQKWNAFKDQLQNLYHDKDFENIVKHYASYETTDVAELQILGLANFQTGNSELGEKIFKKALANCPTHKKNDIRLNLAKCWFNSQHYRKAIKYLQEIPYEDLKYSFAEGEYEVPSLTGISYYKIEKYEAALEAFKKAPINKKDVNAQLNDIIVNIGECYEALGNNKMAVKFYNKALSNDITLIELEEKIERLEGMEA